MRKWMIALLLSTSAPALAQIVEIPQIMPDVSVDLAVRQEATGQRQEVVERRAQVQVAERSDGERRGGGGGDGERRGGGGGWRHDQSGQQPQAQAPIPEPQPQAQPQPQRGNWGGNGGGGWQNRQAAPAEQAQPQQRAERRQWGDRGGWRGQQNGQAIPVPAPQAAPPARNWGGNDGNRWGNRGATPVPSSPQGGWDRDRETHTENRAENHGQNRGGEQHAWNRGNDGQWNRQGGGMWNRNGNGGWERRDGDRHDGDRHFDQGRDNRWGNSGTWNNRDNRSWDRGWRTDRRYDWQSYRNQYRSYYSQPRYYNPYGYDYDYERFGIGIYLDNLFFSSRYWINNPGYYRLPNAPYGYHWVRYYDDVLLVDIRSGYVVDVIYDFFD